MTIYCRHILYILLITACDSHWSNDNPLITSVVSNYHIEVMDNSYVCEGTFRELAKMKDKYCAFTDGSGFIQSSGYNCPVAVDNFSFFARTIRKSDRSKPWLSLLDNTYRKHPIKYQTDYRPGYNAAFAAFRFFEEKGPLAKNEIKNYKFLSTEDDSNIVKANFINLEGDSTYVGYLIIDKRSCKLLKISMQRCPLFSEFYQTQVNSQATIDYHYINGRYYPKKIEFASKDSLVEYSVLIDFKEPLVNNIAFNNTEYQIISENDINPFLQNASVDTLPLANDSMENIHILNDLNSTSSVMLQFKNNNNKPYLTGETLGGDSICVRGGNTTYNYVKEKINQLENLKK